MAENGTATTRAVMITGASTGIGEACALRLDRLGFQVFAGVRKESDAGRLRHHASDRLSPVFVDVADQVSIQSAAETVTTAVGDRGLAGLVNNAGIGVGGPLEFLPLDDLRQQLEVNVVGQIAVTQAMLTLIRKGRGRIVNMGSIGGRMASPFIGPYNASKFAMEALTDSLRQELRPWDIAVSIIEPGNIATPIWDKAKSSADDVQARMTKEANDLYGPALAAVREAIIKFQQEGISPDEVAKAVVHALTASRPKTRYVVGRDAQLQRFLVKVVPDRVRDRLVAQQLGL